MVLDREINNENGAIKIVGILLLRNEDIYIERIVANIESFCDEILIADNASIDRTPEIVRTLQSKFPKIQYKLIKNPSESHQLIEGLAGQPVWIFAVDGDELYDRSGLSLLRRKILLGEYKEQWMILGNVLHCIELNLEKQYALGYLAPPCRSMTKLYNFEKIVSWEGPCPERLHGGNITFRPGYSNENRLMLYDELEWENSFFRCLHLCFLPRSSKDKGKFGKHFVRENISDKNSRSLFSRILIAFSVLGITKGSKYKRKKYMRGPIVEKEIKSFLSDVI